MRLIFKDGQRNHLFNNRSLGSWQHGQASVRSFPLGKKMPGCFIKDVEEDEKKGILVIETAAGKILK